MCGGDRCWSRGFYSSPMIAASRRYWPRRDPPRLRSFRPPEPHRYGVPSPCTGTSLRPGIRFHQRPAVERIVHHVRRHSVVAAGDPRGVRHRPIGPLLHGLPELVVHLLLYQRLIAIHLLPGRKLRIRFVQSLLASACNSLLYRWLWLAPLPPETCHAPMPRSPARARQLPSIWQH